MPSTSNAASERQPLPQARQRPITEIGADTRTPVVQRIIGHARRDVARFSSAP